MATGKGKMWPFTSDVAAVIDSLQDTASNSSSSRPAVATASASSAVESFGHAKPRALATERRSLAKATAGVSSQLAVDSSSSSDALESGRVEPASSADTASSADAEPAADEELEANAEDPEPPGGDQDPDPEGPGEEEGEKSDEVAGPLAAIKKKFDAAPSEGDTPTVPTAKKEALEKHMEEVKGEIEKTDKEAELVQKNAKEWIQASRKLLVDAHQVTKQALETHKAMDQSHADLINFEEHAIDSTITGAVEEMKKQPAWAKTEHGKADGGEEENPDDAEVPEEPKAQEVPE
jgi:hypothetical protein